MDIVSHAAAGAATGFAFNAPITGALLGAAPDVVLGIKRKLTPSRVYDFTHSLVFALLLSFSSLLFGGVEVAVLTAFCVASHLVLDIPTHGKSWAPPLFFPLSNKRFSLGNEWEWGNPTWKRGLILTLIWISLWISISFFTR